MGSRRRFLLALLLALALPARAGAVTLEQYFAYSPTDRAMYLAGVLDLLIVDASRPPEFRDCVQSQGLVGIHDALIEAVEEDRRLLDFNAAIWILYEARLICREAAGKGPPPERPAVPAAAPPAPAAPEGGATTAAQSPPEIPAPEALPAAAGGAASAPLGGWQLLAVVLAASAVGVLGGALLAFLVRRRRRADGRPLPRILK